MNVNEQPHEALVKLLPWYVNGTLDESESHIVAEHVEHCDECAEEVAELRDLELAVMAVGKEEALPEFDGVDRVLAEIAEKGRRKEGGARIFRFPPARIAMWAAIAAALVFAIFIPRYLNQPAMGEMATLQDSSSDQYQFLKMVRGDNMTTITPKPGQSALQFKIELHLGISVRPSRDYALLRCELKQTPGDKPLAIANGKAVDEAFGVSFPSDDLASGYYYVEVYGLPAQSPSQEYKLLKTYGFKLERQ